VETYCCALSKVTFGPTFRAEKQHRRGTWPILDGQPELRSDLGRRDLRESFWKSFTALLDERATT